MKHYLLLLFSLMTGAATFAQLHCGTDEMHQQLYLQHPEYKAGIRRAYDRSQQFAQEYATAPHLKSDPTYIIPVVFHVIHNYGPENISDAQIHDALKQVNLQFRKLNPDTSDIVSAFQSIAADIQIEFRLAQLDPDGNCTSGITRTQSLTTYTGDHSVKSVIHWPPEKYLNIYICAEAAGLAGHALMPHAADSVPAWDGIVMQHSYTGTIGTSTYFRRTVLTHEIGHYLNLQHIWGGNNVPEFPYLPVGDPGNCAYDDDVTDTPNTIGWSTCNLNAQSCSSLDNVQNYMDYAYCALMFTEGQKQRMHAALNDTTANRNNLWQPANLAATGTDNLTNYLCKAKFDAAKTVVCEGEPVLFTDISYHGVISRLWNFEGGTAVGLTEDTVSVIYSTAGTYDVTLTVSNGTDTLSVTIPDYITVLPAVGTQQGLTEDFESETVFNNTWFVDDHGTPLNWIITNPGYASSQSISIPNFNSGTGIEYGFHSFTLNTAGLSTFAISYDWAYAQRADNDADVFRILISNDCGDSWQVKKSYSGISTLPSVSDTLSTPFTPAGTTEWNSDTIYLNSASLTDHLLVKFYFISKGGNNFYLDNIRMGHPDVLGIPAIQTLDVQAFPNPASESVTVSWSETGVVEHLRLINALGQTVYQQPVSNDSENVLLELSRYANGYYTLCLEGKSGLRYIPQIIRH